MNNIDVRKYIIANFKDDSEEEIKVKLEGRKNNGRFY